MEWRDKNVRQAVMISLAFHALAMVIMAFLRVYLPFQMAELTEITFVSGQVKLSAPPPLPAAQMPIPEERKAPTEVVTLPPRKMLEKEPPQLNVPEPTKKLPQEQLKPIARPETDRPMVDSKTAAETKTATGEKVVSPPVSGTAADQKLLPDYSELSSGSGTTPFQIEGQAARRVVLVKVIPEYPEGLQKQATIKIRFTVLPDGQVGEMIPMIRADATLERLTLDALRQWQFSPLAPEEPQVVEQGIITFRYLLK
ncbi:MAG: energy transducer TonB [candidate division KSB1 bacterium]|nr:energy transducer TonB [candidate division KSB1 bacterium]MDZ7318089.1 energy transducer TonB [candidate division KSB1 bacterium]MDZ7341814.1 energy transducer TonB [candidate division KSB1 bacterium]